MKKGFTLIELLAVIIILAVVALIATPIVLNIVNSAKDSAMRSQLALYADSIRNQLTEGYFKNGGKYNEIINLSDDNLDKSITCEEACYTKDSQVILGSCMVKKYDGNYWYINGNVSHEKPSNFDSLKNNVIACNGNISTEYVDNSGANKPKLFSNMIPVIYENNNWFYADIYEKWYDYDLKEWANAVVLNDGVTKNVGDIIDIDIDVSLMFVWVPRYKYTIFNGNNGSMESQEINIMFENGIESTGTVVCNDALNQTDVGENLISETCSTIIDGVSTYTHPAFCFGHRTNGVCDGDELTGIWVGKFENSAPNVTSNTIQKVTIKPNVISWRSAILFNYYTSIMNIKTDYGINADSHLMKNMEWGAVAYLANSKYGRCKDGTCIEVSKNDSSDYYTGRSQGVSPVTSDYSDSGSYTYEHELGQLASTTGNIYGIYDMSGGAWERVMGNMVNSTNQFYSGSAGFSTNPDPKYYDAYTYGSSSSIFDGSQTLTHSRGRLGDATKETMAIYGNTNGGWYSDRTCFPHHCFQCAGEPWFVRGGEGDNGGMAGIFGFSYDSGQSSIINVTSRSALVSATG